MSFTPRNQAEEREFKNAENWKAIRGQLKIYKQIGFLLLLGVALTLAYFQGERNGFQAGLNSRAEQLTP